MSISREDLVLISRYFCVKHDPAFMADGAMVTDCERDHVILCFDEDDAKAMCAALNRIAAYSPERTKP